MSPRRLTPLLLMALVLSCKEDSKPRDTQAAADTAPPVLQDADGDGVSPADGDCDDNDPNVHRGQEESCNGVDDNCNGLVDEGYPDADGDGIADCVDTEECDGVDNDGDGEVDEGFPDDDGDGIADCAEQEVCDGVDNDGDGEVDEGFDQDGDGYTSCGTDELPADCDDTDPEVSPGAKEIVGNLQDDDCDGLIDETAWHQGDLVIDEIMVNPAAVSDAHGEWFEVYNASGHDLFLNGLVIGSVTDGERHVVTDVDVLLLHADEHFVFGVDADETANGGVVVDYQYEDVTLSNEVDDLYIEADGVLIDSVSWDDGLTMPDPSGASIGLDPAAYSAVDNDDPTSWCAATEPWDVGTDYGSPGATNELCSTWDHDGDGYSRDEGDCDDTDPRVYPGAPELDEGVDNDCDGEAELKPVAVADYDAAASTLYTCDALYLQGSASYDPDGTALSYSWTLDAAPAGSSRTTDDIEQPTDADPVFYPDVAGIYAFTLTVTDEGDTTDSASVVVTVSTRPSNTAPVADAGSDQSASATASCSPITTYSSEYTCEDCEDYDFTLDGTGTTDADGDPLSYSWTVLSGSGTLSDSTSATPTLTVTGPSATYGSSTTETVEVQLTVTDCMGETSTDTVTVTYTCTGS